MNREALLLILHRLRREIAAGNCPRSGICSAVLRKTDTVESARDMGQELRKVFVALGYDPNYPLGEKEYWDTSSYERWNPATDQGSRRINLLKCCIIYLEAM